MYVANNSNGNFRFSRDLLFFLPANPYCIPGHASMQSRAAGKLALCRTGLRIASKQNRRQVGARWLVVKADGHQGHWLDNTEAILKAPAKQSGIARRDKKARPLELRGFGDQ